jgi:hypothetical protein
MQFRTPGDPFRSTVKAARLPGSRTERLSADLSTRFGRGFSVQNLENLRLFYQAYADKLKSQTVSGISPTTISQAVSVKSPPGISEASSRKFDLDVLAACFPLPWSHYVLLVRRSRSPEAMEFYQTEALRGGWSIRTLDRQMSTLLFERTALSRDKTKMLTKHAAAKSGEQLSGVEAVRDPYILEWGQNPA